MHPDFKNQAVTPGFDSTTITAVAQEMTHPILDEKGHDSAKVMADNDEMLPPE